MRGATAALMASLLACTVLAGCSGEPATSTTDGDGTIGIPDPPVDASTGAIKGVLVDEAIVPIGNATVTLGSTGRNATTTASGTFSFADVQPGTYFLAASGFGVERVQTSVEVKAGEVATAKMLARRAYLAKPYHDTTRFDGFIEASASIGTYAVNIVYEGVLEQGSPLCTCTLNFTAPADTVGITYEAVWQDNVPNPTGPLDLYYEVYPANNVTTETIQSAFEPSPILHYFDINATWGDAADGQFVARLSDSSTGVAVEQPYQMFITLWHNAPPPSESWSIVAGDK